MPETEDKQRELFLMSPPGAQWQLRGRANFRSGEAEQVDASAAFEEWHSLAREIENAGGRVLVLPSDDSMTGLPYCAEAGHSLPPEGDDPRPRFLLPRMWAPHRKSEIERWAPFATRLGFRTIQGDRGYWEGQGDVATFQERCILFFGGRTDAEGLATYRSQFPSDALTIEVRQPAFHGNVALLSMDACNSILVCPELLVGDSLRILEDSFGKDVLLPISLEEAKAYATNALPVGSRLIAPSIAPTRVLDALAERGMTIITLSMRELCEKAGGASRCLVCRIPASIAATLADANVSEMAGGLERLAQERRG
jgi:N-dimethylarginine dimethylaminohydrolase